MIFSSVMFLFRFLPLFVIGYFLVPGRMKNIILLFGSLFFYAWGEPVYVLLMLFSILSDYVHGRLIEHNRGGRAARLFLISSIVINLLLLSFFKYADFLIQLINQLTGASIPLLELPLPIGISFYTFQTMSYSIDVYRGEVKAQKNLLDFAVFVTMFPQLIAGPIVKYKDVEDKLHDRHITLRNINDGVFRFVTGLAKKVLLANNVGLLWDSILGEEFASMPVLTAWLGVLAYGLQIYFDFSGYSDMAIGLGACMGFGFPENFRYPYISTSITEFWRRWHISLGSWFREYVYIPLGGNQKGLPRQLINITIVWALTGIWHGAGLNFLLWGLWFAAFLILEKAFLGKILRNAPKGLGMMYVSVVMLIGWALFAVEGQGKLMQYLGAMFGLNEAGFYSGNSLYLIGEYGVLLVLGIIGSTPLVKSVLNKIRESRSGIQEGSLRLLEKVYLIGVFLLSVAYIVEASYNPFLYFRF